MNTLLLIQLIAAHLVSDFILQPDAWVESRKNNHWKSKYLYLHCAITALIAWLIAIAIITGLFIKSILP